MGQIFSSLFSQVVFIFGSIIVFGFIIRLINKAFYNNMGRYGLTACYVTGFIGTPVHELAHAFFCLVFGHTITEMKLFQVSSSDGTLGYVCHSYNPKNLYHKIGNFFIGIAPILIITLVLYLLALWLVPAMISEISARCLEIDLTAGIGDIFSKMFAIVATFFSYIGNGKWWLFVFIGMFLALHMTLSPADMKGAASGVVSLITLMLIINVILWLAGSSTLARYTVGVLSVAGYLCGFLMLGVIISFIALILSYILKLIIK